MLVMLNDRKSCINSKIMYTGLNPSTSCSAAHPNLETAAVKKPIFAVFVKYSSSE